MRSILLHIHDDPCLDARIQVALDLARACNGHVICLQAVPYEYGIPGDIYGPMATQLYPAFRENAAKLRETIEARLANEDVTWDWISQGGMAQNRLLLHAGLSDIIIMGACAENKGRTTYSALAAEIAISAQTPVFLIPEHCSSLDITAPVAIAWNGSPEASRALRAAVPLMQHASTVYLLTVTGDQPEFDLPAIEGASYLARHGIEAEMVELPQSPDGIRSALINGAKARNAGWVVMGAYGRTRLRERILGGVSRSMMTQPALPIFLAH